MDSRVRGYDETLRAVIPAKAGIHFRVWVNMNSRVRGNDEATVCHAIPASTPRMYANDTCIPGRGSFALISYSRFT
ncbi:hypothetical protein BH11GEM2_BH11GEM2_33510 [soil metagenome]